MPCPHDLHLIVTTRPATFFSKISSEMVNVLLQAVHVIGNDIPHKRTRSVLGRRHIFLRLYGDYADFTLSYSGGVSAQTTHGQLQ